MRRFKLVSLVLTTAAILMMASASSYAEEKQGNDKTGTNPIDFSRDFRVYNEYSALNTEGDGTQNLTTAEIRLPFADGKWQWRLRARLNSIEADLNDDGSDDLDDSGLGDWDMRFLTVFDLNMESKTAWAGGLEVFMNTADEDALGAGSTSLGPQLFYVKFLPTGLFAPGLQYKFSVDEDEGRSDVDQILIDLNYLRMADDKKSWFFTDPQLVFDNETDIEFAIVDLEWGWMMATWYDDLTGHSFYVRPSFGLGADRPVEGSVELGYKIVGW
jgi:hypothetical protein